MEYPYAFDIIITKEITRTKDISQKTDDRRHTQFLGCLLLLSINQNKETNANQAVSQ